MNKFFIIAAVLAATACTDTASRSAETIPGTYERRWKHQAGTLYETIIIKPTTGATLQFDVIRYAQHLDTSKVPKQRRPSTTARYRGIYYPSRRMLDLETDGLKYYFDMVGDTLRSGTNIYVKHR